MGDNNGISRNVHGATVSHLNGLFGSKMSASSNGTGRLLGDFVDLPTAGQFNML